MPEQRSARPSILKRVLFRCFTLVLLVAVVWMAAELFLATYQRYGAPAPGSLRYGLDRLSPLYPGMTDSEIEQLLTETWSREYVYAPLVQHREGAIEGRFVNVDPAGFRHSANQGPWPPEAEALNVFVYGGSTTFGYGVADAETIPSRLQEELTELGCGPQVAVYNFGRGNYYSEQERVLFETHLTDGLKLDVAVFVDGVNEWKEAPKFTDRLDYMMSESRGQLIARALKSLPMLDLARLARGPAPDPEDSGSVEPHIRSERFLERWLRSKRLVTSAAGEFGVSPIFVWQPAPTYDYPPRSHPLAADTEALFAGVRYQVSRQGYESLDRMRATRPELEPAGDFLWLADMQRGRSEPLYVDALHYSAGFCRDIAVRVAVFVAGHLDCNRGGPRPS